MSWFKNKYGAAQSFSLKKCPYCFTMLKLDTKKCDMCKKAVGKVNKAGFAEKYIDWKAYITAFLAWTAFFVYVWWAFFRK